MYLTTDQISNFKNEGYLVLEDFWNIETIQCLKDKMNNIISSLDFKVNQDSLRFPKTVFTTNEQQRNTDSYFLESIFYKSIIILIYLLIYILF